MIYMWRLGQLARQSRGFTIVELLIVIVVIGILATLSIVAYNGVQTRALNTAKDAEMRAWVEIFESYRALNGGFPVRADGAGYCLGTGFPDANSDGVGDCRVLLDPPNRYSVDSTLNDALKTVSTLPNGPRKAVNGSLGPFVQYFATFLRVVEVIEGNNASDCPKGTTYLYDDPDGKLQCYIQLDF